MYFLFASVKPPTAGKKHGCGLTDFGKGHGNMGTRAIRRDTNGQYRVNYYFRDQHGQKRRGRKWFRTLHLAETFFADRLREFEAGQKIGTRERETLTVKQFLDGHYFPWATKARRGWEREMRFLRLVERRWGSRRLCDISYFDIEKWRLEFKETACAASIRKYLAWLRAMFRFAHTGTKDEDGHIVGGGFIGDDPMSKIKSPSVKFPTRPPTILAPEEIAQIKPDGTRGTDIALFALYSGMRKGEILRVRYSDIDLVAGVVRIPISKNNEPRIVPLTPELSAIIDRQPRDGSDYVFSWKGKPIKNCRTSFRLALKRAGITRRVRLHDFRHTFGSYLAMNGVDIDERMTLMGHKTYEAARIYTHYYTKKLSETMTLLTKAYDGVKRKTKGQFKGSGVILAG
ncbi:MAG: hypothetical protein A3G34_16160 [Candidatus Lindowbacteria bacterium RIFCSPLOWO2_12_FULL_62_27]|nr:MAG: hypothetical protein A3I06_12295 [Candidatus Lindowbacteria bacterium RIFCSPLOWO2_02_FULL_62_12]OGH61158.1 MAG: hypothetical protein A3G34_16160 [Candidatus Lindowbacteria bacterium RIFCSPLOWO2_12_FULL_62_27]